MVKKSLTAEAELKELKDKNEELAASLKRVAADFDNFRKRVDKEKDEAKHSTNSELILKLFPILDNFRRAADHAPAINVDDLEKSAISEEEWRRIHAYFGGVQQIERQLEQVLSHVGLKRIETIGKSFNHHTMEAISYEPHSELPADTVIDEVEGGYKYGDKVIRPAKVRVSKGSIL